MQLKPQDHLYSLGIGLQRFYCNLQLIHLLLVISWCPCPAFWCAINLLLSCYVQPTLFPIPLHIMHGNDSSYAAKGHQKKICCTLQAISLSCFIVSHTMIISNHQYTTQFHLNNEQTITCSSFLEMHNFSLCGFQLVISPLIAVRFCRHVGGWCYFG